MTVNFKKWYVEDDHDTYNFPNEAMETAFNAGKEKARLEVLIVVVALYFAVALIGKI